MNDSMIRDSLALERTRLANERTLLAYIRTALSLLAGGAIVLQFFTHQAYVSTAAWLLIICGGVTLIIGALRFFQVRRQLSINISSG